jgi:DNA-binding MarR family transcriptional regulator
MQNDLTPNEMKVMTALAFSHYGDGEGGVWSWAIDESNSPTGLPKTSLGGIVSSLVKKGYAKVELYDRNDTVIWFTPKGLELARSINGSAE